jgi:hypothetical protein
MALLDFFSREAGRQRRAWLDEQARDLGGLLQYFAGPGVNVESTVRAADMLNPVADVGRAIQSSRDMVAPGRTPAQRAASGLRMATDVASVAAPGVAGGLLNRMGGNAADTATQAADATVDSLLGFVPGRGGAAMDGVLERANQRGPVPTMYSNPLGIDDYAGIHRAPGRDPDNASLDDLTALFPDDIYDRRVAARYYGHMEDPIADQEMIDLFTKMRGNPDATVPVYRAVPSDVDARINPGDWVTPSRRYAVGHGEGPLGGNYRIIEGEARAGDLFTDANSIFEFGYDPVPQGIRAYHGSPHDFDRFQMDRIGTGEGAQAYGHGLYFAENEDVARSYRDKLSNPDYVLPGLYDGKSLSPDDPVESLMQIGLGQYFQHPVDSAIRQLEKLKRHVVDDDFVAKYDEAIRRLEDSPRTKPPTPSMYEVRINANPDDFLDWDAPLSEQPKVAQRLGLSTRTADEIDEEAIRLMTQGNEAAGRAGGWMDDPEISARIDALNDEIDRLTTDASGESIYRSGGQGGAADLMSQLGGGAPRLRTQEFRDAGIPGIKYRDAGSRGTNEGTRNFVVFDENLIEIVRKYGIAGTAALLGMNASEVEARMNGGARPGGLLGMTQAEQDELRAYLAQNGT